MAFHRPNPTMRRVLGLSVLTSYILPKPDLKVNYDSDIIPSILSYIDLVISRATLNVLVPSFHRLILSFQSVFTNRFYQLKRIFTERPDLTHVPFRLISQDCLYSATRYLLRLLFTPLPISGAVSSFLQHTGPSVNAR